MTALESQLQAQLGSLEAQMKSLVATAEKRGDGNFLASEARAFNALESQAIELGDQLKAMRFRMAAQRRQRTPATRSVSVTAPATVCMSATSRARTAEDRVSPISGIWRAPPCGTIRTPRPGWPATAMRWRSRPVRTRTGLWPGR